MTRVTEVSVRPIWFNIFMSKTDIFIGKCIYCGDQGETDEHIVSHALGGKHILRKASCEKCRIITSQWERNPLKENWAEARAALDYPSRHRNLNDETFPLKVTLKDGTETVLDLKKAESFGLASFLEYPLPAFFSGNNFKKGALIIGTSLIGFGTDWKQTVEKYGIKVINHSVKYKGTHFERMVIRIAYCAAIGTWGVDCFEDCFALPAIMGTREDVGYFMGCDPFGQITPLIGKVAGANCIKTGVWQKNGDDKIYATVRLKFFASSDAPEYLIVLGTLKKEKIL